MSVIKQFFTNKLKTTPLYPKTLTKAVVDETTGARLDNTLTELNESLGKLNATKLGTLKVANEVVTLTGNISNYKYILFLYDDGGTIRGTHLIPVNLFTTVNKVQFTYLYGTQTKYDVIYYVSDNQMKEEIANGWTYVYGISF